MCDRARAVEDARACGRDQAAMVVQLARENGELRAENERLRDGLQRIADAQSGVFGWWALDTLDPEGAAERARRFAR